MAVIAALAYVMPPAAIATPGVIPIVLVLTLAFVMFFIGVW